MKNILLLGAVVLLSGCAGLLDLANSTNCLEKVYVTEVAITKAYETNFNLLFSEMIDVDTSRNAKSITDLADTAANAAGSLCSIDEPLALDYLKEAGTALKEVNIILGEAND